MIRNLFFKSLQVCFALVLFYCLTACGVDVYIDNQTQDNISLEGDHIKKGQKELVGMIGPGNDAEWEISRSYGFLATIYVTCPEDLDMSQISHDTIVITEPERNRFQASAQELTVSISNIY